MARLERKMLRTLISSVFVGWFGTCFSQDLKLDLIRTFNGHSHGVRHVVFSPDGSHFASGGTRGEVFIWDIEGSEPLKKLEGHYGSVTDVRYSENGKYVVTAGDDGQIKVWDAETGYLIQSIISPTNDESPVNKVRFAIMSSINQTIYFGGTNRFLSSVPLNGDKEPEVIYSDPKEEIRCAILSPDGKELIFASGKYLLAIELTSGEIVREYNTGSCLVNSLEFSDDGKRLLTWCDNSRVDMRDPSSFYLLTSFRSGTGGNKFSNLAFTEDQKYVITGDHASRFNVWDLNNKQRVLDQGAEQGTIMSFDLESGPNYLLSGSLDKSIKLWQIVKNELEETKKKPKKKLEEPPSVSPEVEIVQYNEPVEDVPQHSSGSGPAKINVVLKEQEVINTYEPIEPANQIVCELPERINNRRVTPIRQEHRLNLKSHQLTFEIWDAQIIDGDIVSIFIDDICVVEEYSITAAKKRVEFDARKYKKVYLFLHAHNVGTIPPNTVTMTVSDGTQVIELQLRSDLTGSSAMEITFDDDEE